MLKCLQSLWQKPPLSNPRRRHVLWLLCVVTTGQVKNAPKLHPQVADAMASQAASLVTNPALVVMANQAVTVVVSFQAVGTLLVFGMLIAPAGAGALLARRVLAMVGWAAGIGSASVYVGLLLSFHYDLAAGATIVFVTVVVFFVVFVVQSLRGSRPAADDGHVHTGAPA